ncbi:hypothetical protein ABGI61_00065 [Rheinheimera sp. FR7-31]|uniref:hypothetical protein n=1 Tax=Rheinheimera fenheensis TaxID=3152295 RepID=UPI00325ECD46
MKRLALAFGLFFAFTDCSSAQDVPSNNFDIATKYIENHCDFEELKLQGYEFDKWFPDYDKFVTEKALKACLAIFGKKEQRDINIYWPQTDRVAILSSNLEQIATSFKLNTPNTQFPILKTHYESWLHETDLPTAGYDQYHAPRPPRFDKAIDDIFPTYYLSKPDGTLRRPQFSLSGEQNTYCTSAFNGAADCDEVFEAFNKVTNKISVFQKLRKSAEFETFVKEKEAQWDKFADNSRFQTFVDVAFTSFVYRKRLSLSDRVVSPPPLQLFALRPSLVYEHLPDAPQGSRDELALALEWVGFNAWNLKFPFGVSITSVYADREFGNSVGHGLTFHVNNNFSFGFANRGNGENSIYVNVELMDWFGNKQKKIEKYKSYQF